MRVAAYLRISTDLQCHSSQKSELEAYCAHRGWEPKWFVETASGAKRDRTELDRMMALVRTGRVDALVVFKLDRLARSLPHLAQLIAEFATHKVALIVPSQGIDTSISNPTANLQINILGAFADFERDLIIQRVRAGIGAAKERGVKLGRPSLHAEKRYRVSELMAEGFNAATIARTLSLPASTVREMVREIQAENRRALGFG